LRRPVLAQRLPEVLQSPGETLDRRVPPKAAKRSQVTEHGSAFTTCGAQQGLRAFEQLVIKDQRTAKWTANAQRPAGTHEDAGALDQQVEAYIVPGWRVA
jgi:hypothetical protein